MCFLADLKHLDNDKFAKFTGGDAALVMKTLKAGYDTK